MNQPDKDKIIAWMNGELDGTELDHMEAWANEHPEVAEQLASELETPFAALAAMSKEIEPPYADFLNSKIRQGIEADEHAVAEVTTPEPIRQSIWSKFQLLFVPVALAAMAVCFVMGMQFGDPGSGALTDAGGTGAATEKTATLVYVPSEAVTVATMDTAEESFIVLEGLEPIADDGFALFSPQDPEDSIRYVSKQKRNEGWY